MGATSPPFVEQNASHSAALFRRMVASFLGATQPGTLTSPASSQVGVNGNNSTAVGGVVNLADLAVTQHGTANMSVTVAGGSCFIPQTQAANGGLYYAFSTGTTNLSVSASNPTNPRIDLVCATVKDKAYSGSTTDWLLQVVTGTPTSGATLTNLSGAPSLPAASIPLAYILVPANATTIITADLKTVRPYTGMGNPQRGTPYALAWATSQSTQTNGAGGYVNLGGYTLKNGFTSGSPSKLIVPSPGLYLCVGSIDVNTKVTGVNAYIIHNGSQVSGYATYNASISVAMVPCVANDYLQLGFYNDTGNSRSVQAQQYGTYLHVVLVAQ